MTCREMDAAIASHAGDLALPDEAAEHLVECEGCRLLVRAFDNGHASFGPPEGRLRQIQATIKEDLRPVRPLASSSVFSPGVLAHQSGSRGDRLSAARGERLECAQQHPEDDYLCRANGQPFSARHFPWSGRWPLERLLNLPPASADRNSWRAHSLKAAVIFRVRQETAFVPDGLACLRTGLTYSIPAAVLFWVLLSRGAVLYPKLTGAAAGGFAGLIGVSVLEVGCSNLDVYHILVWHLGVILRCVIGGLSLGAAVDRFRRRSIR